MTKWLAGVVAAIAGLSGMAGAWAAGEWPLPIFDTHMHYSQPAWSVYPPAAVITAMDEAGVPRALVSSTPDDGTLTLYRHDPSRFTPELRPYREGVGLSNWTEAPGTVEYIDERLRIGGYKGIGEFHLHADEQVRTPIMRAVIDRSVRHGLYLHIHSGAGPVRAVFAVNPGAKVLWAHAGMSEPADVVAEMLGRYPTLVTEVSFRAGEIGAGGINPAWRDVLLKFSDRIMIGTDTYVTARWGDYKRLVEEHRAYLYKLPREAAEAIAYRNAVRLFGDGGRREFLPQ
jgi:hypothetical protein